MFTEKAKELLSLIQAEYGCILGIKLNTGEEKLTEIIKGTIQEIYDTAVDIGRRAERVKTKKGFVIWDCDLCETIDDKVYMSRETAEIIIKKEENEDSLLDIIEVTILSEEC
jgi:hypothetical protein